MDLLRTLSEEPIDTEPNPNARFNRLKKLHPSLSSGTKTIYAWRGPFLIETITISKVADKMLKPSSKKVAIEERSDTDVEDFFIGSPKKIPPIRHGDDEETISLPISNKAPKPKVASIKRNIVLEKGALSVKQGHKKEEFDIRKILLGIDQTKLNPRKARPGDYQNPDLKAKLIELRVDNIPTHKEDRIKKINELLKRYDLYKPELQPR